MSTGDGPMGPDDRAAALESAEEDLWEAYLYVHQLRRSVVPIGRADVRSAVLHTESALDRLHSVVEADRGR